VVGRVLSLDGRITTQWVVNEMACVVRLGLQQLSLCRYGIQEKWRFLLTQDCFFIDEAVVWRWVGVKISFIAVGYHNFFNFRRRTETLEWD
jgi:hypothetical protein